MNAKSREVITRWQLPNLGNHCWMTCLYSELSLQTVGTKLLENYKEETINPPPLSLPNRVKSDDNIEVTLGRETEIEMKLMAIQWK